jgi:hypothetical protein
MMPVEWDCDQLRRGQRRGRNRRIGTVQNEGDLGIPFVNGGL